jgi:hypothetical protein
LASPRGVLAFQQAFFAQLFCLYAYCSARAVQLRSNLCGRARRHNLMSARISSSVQGLTSSLVSGVGRYCAGLFWRAYGGIGGRQM